MKHLILTLIFLIPFFYNSQTLLEFDRMETSSTLYLSAGWFVPAATTGWFNNASVTPTLSAVIYGSGNGTSANEQDWYSMPNKTGLNPARQYQLRFRLASYTFSNSTANTRGVDVSDYVSVQVSTNGGVSYVNELRITGNSNSLWNYNATGSIIHTANGVFTNSAPPAGDVYQAPVGTNPQTFLSNGPTNITLNLPTNISQVAIDIFCRVNSAGEEWWIDNIELWDMTIPALPIELVEFNGKENGANNLLYWITASEQNNDYFTIERTVDGENWETVSTIMGAGNSQSTLNYSYSDDEYVRGKINYYRLSQTDFDGNGEMFNIVSIDNTLNKRTIVKLINLNGQEIDESTANGIYIEVYDDGSMKRVYKQ